MADGRTELLTTIAALVGGGSVGSSITAFFHRRVTRTEVTDRIEAVAARMVERQEQQIVHQSSDIDDLRHQIRELHTYIAEDLRWHEVVRTIMQANGMTLPDAPVPPWTKGID